MAKIITKIKSLSKKWNLIILVLILLLASFLRIWKLNQNPVSLFGDEVEVGYQAYSILKTGRDYQGNFMPIHFHSLAEWRTPLYLYSAVPTVFLFGITPLGVRFPAAICGILGVFALYLLVRELFKNKEDKGETIALLSAFLLAVNPWHIQYSRAGFEVTQLILFLLLGLYFFFRSLGNDGKKLWISTLFFALTLWVYSTAKLFTPFFLLFIFVVYFKEIISFSKKNLIYAVVTLLIIGLPIGLGTILGGGAQRFGYISIFSDPTTSPEVGNARLRDAYMRGEFGVGLNPKLPERLIHNKFTFWGEGIIKNYLKSFSTDFLFIKGDPNLRHSIGIGEFYRIEIIALILGIIFFFTGSIDKKVKKLFIFWILFGVFPAAITRDGGNHATRLIIILPALIVLITYGLYQAWKKISPKYKNIFILIYSLCFVISFIFYQHEYWVHYPWNSERWWHYGFKEAFDEVKKVEGKFDKIVISTANEPPWVFFAGLYKYPPKDWQKNYPLNNKTELPGFGNVSYIDKFYFASPQDLGFYDWGKVLDKKTLYVASATEVNVNLIMEPERIAPGLTLLKAIAYPSGEPAFYIFSGQL